MIIYFTFPFNHVLIPYYIKNLVVQILFGYNSTAQSGVLACGKIGLINLTADYVGYVNGKRRSE